MRERWQINEEVREDEQEKEKGEDIDKGDDNLQPLWYPLIIAPGKDHTE